MSSDNFQPKATMSALSLGKHMILLIEVLVFVMFFDMASAKIFTTQRVPVITDIEPYFGGAEGGTKIVISGANFNSDSLFTKAKVYFGNSLANECDTVDHFSGDTRLVCYTPKCRTEVCNNGNIWSGTSTVEVSVYVTGVEGILFATSQFTYYNYWAPNVYAMQTTAYATAVANLEVSLLARSLTELDIFIGNFHADLGEDGALNDDDLAYTKSTQKLWYRALPDAVAGHHNLTLQQQDDLSDGITSTSGFARMFGEDKLDSYNYDDFYMFQSSLMGTVHSLTLLPTITSVSPSLGSIAGGTKVLVSGSGFSDKSKDIVVYVGGLPCLVTESDSTFIRCTTSPRLNVSEAGDYSDEELTATEYENRRLLLAAADIPKSNHMENFHVSDNPNSRSCRTPVLSEKEVEAENEHMKHLLSKRLKEHKVYELSTQIDVYFHIVTTSSGAHSVTDEQLAEQLDVLNTAFSASGFTFTEVGRDVTSNDAWSNDLNYGSIEEESMKMSLRKGDAKTLNFYTADLAGGLLGWATYPSGYASKPGMDGVVNAYWSLPGASDGSYGLGMTAVHEVGHWLGLYHTFQGGCSGVGDRVDDTPAVAEPNYGCPGDVDSCPNDSGNDMTWNFMDYTDDACMSAFTSGQMNRMLDQFNSYRADAECVVNCDNTPSLPPTVPPLIFRSARDRGSQGWWVKVWNRDDYNNGNVGVESAANMQFGWRQDMFFSFYYRYGGYGWVDDAGFSTYSTNYWADAGAVFTAPLTGNYTFLTVGDDNQHLYASSMEMQGIDEILLCYNSYVGGGDYFKYASQSSEPVYLVEGEELYLRYRMQNWGGGDYASLSIKISPEYDDNSGENLYRKSPLPQALLQHHSVKEIQELDLTLVLEREIQVINFTAVDSADFFFYVQNRKPTITLSLDSTDLEIRYALETAAEEIRQVTSVECRRFSVWREEGYGFVALFVQFEVDTFAEMTLLQIFPTDLVGAFAEIQNPYRFQVHSPRPTDFFRVRIPFDGVGDLKAEIPWDASISTLENIVEDHFDVNVEVSRSGYYLSGYTWRITFEQPLGDIPLIEAESWTIGKVNSTMEVISLQNGTESELFFEPAPVWMFEVPLGWATGDSVNSNVEVYTTSGSGDVLKAVCAGQGEAFPGFWGSVKGSEDQCSYGYAPERTPLITSSNIFQMIDSYTVEIRVVGKNFLLGGVNGTVTALIAGQQCNITSLDDDELYCIVRSVPHGEYAVSLHIEGFGEALVREGAIVTFTQKIDNVYPMEGSLVGGQVLLITGRGFRRDANVSIGSHTCAILNGTTSNLFCVSPPLIPYDNGTHSSNMHVDDGHSHRSLYNDTNATVLISSLKDIAVDGMPFNGSYVYNSSSTPLVDSIYPNELSSAVTQKIEIVGGGFEHGTTVHVDNITCIVQELYVDLIVCLLIRSAPRIKSHVRVYVHVPGKGYAADAGSVLELPGVTFGFDVESLSPMMGSRMGGSQLVLQGYGFLVGMPMAHTILLVKTNKEEDLREQMLIDLGLFSGLAAETMACVPTRVTWTEIYCEVPLQEGLYGNPVGNYTLSVTLNDLPATCADPVTGEDCLFIQDNEHTPMIYESTVTNVDVLTGSLDIELIGGLLFTAIPSDHFDIFMQSEDVVSDCLCSDVSVLAGPTTNTSTLRFRAPNVALGNWTLYVHTVDYGYAAIAADAKFIQTELFVNNVTSNELSKGSLAGNNTAEIHGYGFNPSCHVNVVALSVNGYGEIGVPSCHLISCTETALKFFLPSVINLVIDDAGIDNVADLEVTHITVSTMSGNFSSTALFPYTYTKSLTPTVINTVNPGNGYANDSVTVTFAIPSGANDIDLSLMTMSIGDRFCDHFSFIQAGSTVDLTCRVPVLSGGVTYPVKISVYPFGIALMDSVELPVFTSEFEINVNDPYAISSSIAGGSLVAVSGRGLSTNTSIMVCGIECAHIECEYDRVTCKTSDRRTISSVEYFESIDANMELFADLDGDLFGSYNSNIDLLYDGSYETYFYHSNSNCYVGIELPAGFKAQPYRLRFYPRLQNAYRFGRTVFEGSKDGGATYEVLDSLERADEGWNFFEADEESRLEWFTHFRFRNIDNNQNSYCMMAEIRFVGIIAAIEDTCDITVASAHGLTMHTVGTVTYDASATPYIHSIEPNNGTALGGTEVTLTGSNFVHPDHGHDAPFVYLSGVPCSVTQFNSSTIVCVSGERDLIDLNITDDNVMNMHGNVEMHDDGHGGNDHHRLLDDAHEHHDDSNPNHGDTHAHIVGLGDCVHGYDATFMYIDKWSDLTSWRNQEPPVDHDMVWIPEGQVILLDIDTPLLAMLLIEGKMYFDPNQDINMDAFSVIINGGHFQLGSENEPYVNNANLTLWGDRFTAIMLPHIGTKGIVIGAKGMAHNHGGSHDGEHVMSANKATLKIFGEKRLRTWTHINETAFAGQDFIITSEPVDFRPGELLVLTASEVGSSFEEVTCLFTENFHKVYFSPPLSQTLRSEIRYIEGRTADFRCEVALLTRNIKIQGDPVYSDGQLFGAHTLGMGSDIIYRIQDTEVLRCGQAFVLGRYCTHAHHGGPFEGNFVKANSIHHSYQRAVTTHDTLFWEVRDNVAFNVKGHTYFVEDGNEKYNTHSGNLGIFTKFSSSLLKSDMKPATYWTAIPTNFWHDNVGAHSQKFGFWFELVSEAPPGHITPNVCARGEHLGEFHNMTLKVNSDIGLRIYPQWTPHEDPCDSNSPPAPQTLRTLTSYRHGSLCYFTKKHGQLHHEDYILSECGGDEIHVAKHPYEHVTYSKTPTFLNMLLIGKLDLDDSPDIDPEDFRLGGFALNMPQDEFFYAKDITFYNYGRTPLMSGCIGCDSGEFMKQGAYTYRLEGLKYRYSNVRIEWSRHFKQIFWDLDGSLAGAPNSFVFPFYNFNAHEPSCSKLPSRVFDNSMKCVNTTVRRLEIDYVEPNPLDFTDIRIYGEDGQSDEIYFLPKDIYGWVAPLVTNHTYRLEWTDSETSATEFRLRWGLEEYIKEVYNNTGTEEAIGVQFKPYIYDYDPWSYNTYYDGAWTETFNTSHATLDYPMASSSWYKRTLNVILSHSDANQDLNEPYAVRVKAQMCPPLGCPLPPLPEIPVNYSLWSNASSWHNRGGVKPSLNSEVIIGPDMWIHMDESPPMLKSLTVYGKLTFKQGLQEKLTLKANYIINSGWIEVAGVYNDTLYPFDGEVEIVLSGTKSNSLPVMVGDGIFTGAKNFVNMGDITMIGKPVIKSWVRLADTVNAGATRARLNAGQPGLNQSWAVGDEIVFAPTGYFGKDGKLWSEPDGSVEYCSISAIIEIENNITEIEFTPALNQGHLCMEKEGTSFCGVVALMTHNVKISSEGSEDESNRHWGFGGHIVNVDLEEDWYERTRKLSGVVHFQYVQFINLGKVNSDHYALSFLYTQPHQPSWVEGCSFKNSYNFPIRTLGVNGMMIRDNVFTGNIGGGVYVEPDCKDISILGNVVIGTAQLPSVLSSLYAWTRPIAGFTVESPHVIIKDNVCAGSVDQGFAIATKYFLTSNRGICKATKGTSYQYNEAFVERRGKFDNNEAVGGKVGLMVMAMTPQEVGRDGCSIINGILAWRNAHVGIQALNAEADTFIADVVVAENHIGVLLDVVQFSKEATTGVLHSTVIGALAADGFSDLPDSIWDQRCHAFTGNDPFALSLTCGSVAPLNKRRVGVMVSQFTNRALGCGIDQSFDQCQPPTTPDRKCGMPFDKRYGIPVGMQYTEMHLHDIRFTSFKSNMTNGNEDFDSIAISTNPSQIDATPSLMVSGLEWIGEDAGVMDVPARFGFQNSGRLCESRTCMGLDYMLMMDLDGSATSYDSGAGLLINGNPGYAAPYPKCHTASKFGLGYVFCPEEDGFREYSAMWSDPYGQFAIGPLIVNRLFDDEDENRSFAVYNSMDDACAMRFRKNFYKFMLAPGYHHKVRSTGTVPADWQIRWDSPYDTDSAVVEFFIHGSNAVRVYVGKGDGRYVEVPRFTDRYPTLHDHAGASARNPQKRTLTVTLRGGEYSWYKFVVTPTVSVSMKLEMPFEEFVEEAFVANIALLLGISSSRIKVVEVTRGSVNAVTIIDPVSTGKTMSGNETFNVTIVDEEIVETFVNSTSNSTANSTNSSIIISSNETATVSSNSTSNATTSTEEVVSSDDITAVVMDTVAELEALSQVFAAEIISGSSNFTQIYNIETLEVLVPEVVEGIDSEEEDGEVVGGDQNVTNVNATAELASSDDVGSKMFLISRPPTSQPTGQPSQQPSGEPSKQPSGQPTGDPSVQPSGEPSTQPTDQPTGRPTCQPSSDPSSQPTGEPSGVPSVQPTADPSSIPSTEPSSIPSCRPTAEPSVQPSSEPSAVPTALPTGDPSGQPTSQPSCDPSGRPSSSPSTVPTGQPSALPSSPSGEPTGQPSGKPSGDPSGVPSSQPSALPSSPSGEPTGQPSEQPSGEPSGFPSGEPTGQPSDVPTSQPSSTPTSPTGEPTTVPSCTPTGEPSSQPSTFPSALPTGQPSDDPSGQPSTVPSSAPSTSNPSGVPSCEPSGEPSALPTSPTSEPSGQPSIAPSGEPSSLPTGEPSGIPSSLPSGEPSSAPSSVPSVSPTGGPSLVPTVKPSGQPSATPSGCPSIVPSGEPSRVPSSAPSGEPTGQPSTSPSCQPSTIPSVSPSSEPSGEPSSEPSSKPSLAPTGEPTCIPSAEPTGEPSSMPTGEPTIVPSSEPTGQPSLSPSGQPSACPSVKPSGHPTGEPSSDPSAKPSTTPSGSPTCVPSAEPSGEPSGMPSGEPTVVPSGEPSGQPSSFPSSHPSSWPSGMPSGEPTGEPSGEPSSNPTLVPTGEPTSIPSGEPSGEPSAMPSSGPSAIPSCIPSSGPSGEPTSLPSGQPSCVPSSLPSGDPSSFPSGVPSSEPTGIPSSEPSCIPTSCPSGEPSSEPTSLPSTSPSSEPSGEPSNDPTVAPTGQPTLCPSAEPSALPSGEPSAEPSSSPSSEPSGEPSGQPSAAPSAFPSGEPTGEPSARPSIVPSAEPSGSPTVSPSSEPSSEPSGQPTTEPSGWPTSEPSGEPSGVPSSWPTSEPSSDPSGQPTGEPSREPTGEPSTIPTARPSGEPSSAPSAEPSAGPSSSPSGEPSTSPSGEPSGKPSGEPSTEPTGSPSGEPTGSPSGEPSGNPTGEPSGIPSGEPTASPSGEPSGQPTGEPTSQPSGQPTSIPSSVPTSEPSGEPTTIPSLMPLSQPTTVPTSQPTDTPTGEPSGQPTVDPSGQPSISPTSEPSGVPTGEPSGEPSSCPSSIPSVMPSGEPSGQPSGSPTGVPSSGPSGEPTGCPSGLPSEPPTAEPSSDPSAVPSAEPSSVPSSLPSSEPSSDPSGNPSPIPSAQPSGEPSCVPSTSPTSDPSSFPSGEPSSIPSSKPSASPTGQPSDSPSSFPSARPSYVPTTSKPTGGQITLLRQDVDTGMSGVSCADWDEHYDQALAHSIANVSDGTILQQNVEVISCTDIENRRQLLEGASFAAELLMKRQLSTSSILLKIRIVLILEESGIEDITRDNAFTKLSTMMDNSVQTGKLQSSINTELEEELGEEAPVLSVNSFQADPSEGGIVVDRTREPTSVPSGIEVVEDKLEDSLWFIISMIVVGLTLLLMLLYYIGLKIKKSGSKVYSVGDELDANEAFSTFTNIQDFVRKPKPDDGVGIARSGSRKVMLHDNKVIPFGEDFAHVEVDDKDQQQQEEDSPLDVDVLKGSSKAQGRLQSRPSFMSQESEKMINLESGKSFSELRSMMRSQSKVVDSS